MAHNSATNPFSFGPLALDEAFTDREDELRELEAGMRNGQNVLLYAPRRYGKSSLVLRAAQEAIRHDTLVGYCDLFKITTKEKLAAALAKTIHGDIDSAAGQAFERATNLFRGLRIRPVMELDPEDGSLDFSFRASRRKADIDDTIEALLELLGKLAAERERRVVMIFDEFQEIVDLDPAYPKLLRAVFQAQPEVAHVYLGSKRHVLERIFSDRNEPFWRSAKRMEIDVIAKDKFGRFIRDRFDRTDKGIRDEALDRLLETTGGHPYATQELAYELWELVPTGHFAYESDLQAALEKVLRSEHNHFEQLWDAAPSAQRRLMVALAREPTPSPYATDYLAAHDLPAPATIQTALASLTRKEIAGRAEDGTYTIVEPFFAEWIKREQRIVSLSAQLQQE
jgi:AAA+ ATPase superfamily predicted ATPase